MSTYEPNSRHLREVLIFCFNMKKSAAEAHRMLSNTYGEATISERTCRDAFQRFKNGGFDVEGQHCIWWDQFGAGGIIGPYFFKNDEGHNVTVNGDRYRAMITNFFIPELNNHDVQELWFQQDGATCHTARATIDLLKDTFGDRLISRFGPVNWPPRSCDLTPLDYFLWGYVKSLVYADKPQTLDHLEDNIRRVIADIRPQMLEKVIENWTSRLDYIRANRGSHMPEIIFKM
ncbi:mariner Mos1 transposase [Trichonephila clavipes]|nr:mariner Mos1 transposase [Trichonephila clavipes]